MSDIIRTRELAKLLNMTNEGVRQLAKREQGLTPIQLTDRGRWVYAREEVAAWLRSKGADRLAEKLERDGSSGD